MYQIQFLGGCAKFLLEHRFQNLVGDGHFSVGFFSGFLTDRVGLVVEPFALGVGGPWFKSRAGSFYNVMLRIRFTKLIGDGKLSEGFFHEVFN